MIKEERIGNYSLKRELPSGRWILTLIAGVCLLMLTLALCLYGEDKSISGEAIAAIITAVFTAYFHKNRTDGNGDGK